MPPKRPPARRANLLLRTIVEKPDSLESRDESPALRDGNRGVDLATQDSQLAPGALCLFFYCPRLAGGMMPFMRRYSTIWP